MCDQLNENSTTIKTVTDFDKNGNENVQHLERYLLVKI